MATNTALMDELLLALSSFEEGYDNFGVYLQKMDATKRKSMCLLFEELRKNLPLYEEEAACLAAFGHRKTDSKVWIRLQSNFIAVLKRYVLTEKMYQDELLRIRTMLEVSRDLHLEEIFIDTAEEIDTVEIKAEKRRYDFLAKTSYVQYFKDRETFEPKEDALLKDCAENHDIAYVIQRLEISVEQLLRSILGGKPLTAQEQAVIKNTLSTARPMTLPLIELLVIAVDFYSEPSAAQYAKFKLAFFEKLEDLNSLQHRIYTFLVNALALVKFEGNRMEEYLFLYEYGMEKGLLLEHGRIDCDTFNNIVYLAHILEKDHFLIQFVKNYESFLPKNKKGVNSKNFARCYVLFSQKKFKETLDLLEQIENSTHVFTFRKYFLEFKSIYEKEQSKFDAFVLIDEKSRRFRTLIRRHTIKKHISGTVKRRSLSFFNLLRKIANEKAPNHSKKAIEELFLSLEGKILETRWLKRIISQIK